MDQVSVFNDPTKSGFTLIELLVVIAIVAVLTSLSVVGLNTIRSKSRDTKRVSDIRQMQTALEIYKNDNGTYPVAITSGNNLVGSDGTVYMEKVPTPPGKNDGSCTSDLYTYSATAPYSAYSISYCLGSGIQGVGPGGCSAVAGNMCLSYALRDVGPGGGYIFYDDEIDGVDDIPGYRYLEAAPGNSNPASIRWYNGSNVTTGASGTALGTGLANTNTIIAAQGEVSTSYAAGLAVAYTNNGYSDWFLPSQDELNKLWVNLRRGTNDDNGVATYTPVGTITNGWYWNSTESGSSAALMQFIWPGGGGTASDPKSQEYYVWPIRAF